jgi:hypothetical protein
MQIRSSFFAFAVVAAMLSAVPAHAADPVFPPGSRLGLVPPPGMVPSRNFMGFEDPQQNAAILFTTLPAKAYDSLDKSMVPEAMKRDGVEVDKREPIQLGIGKGFLLSGTQTANKLRYRKWLLATLAGNMTALVTVQVPDQDAAYPDKTVRDTLATLAMRDTVPDSEQLSLMPFTLGDMAGFKIDEALPGRALMLVDRIADAGSASDPAQQPSSDGKDQSSNPIKDTLSARLFIAAMPGGPQEPGDRANFARTMFQQIVGIKDVQIQDAEPLRIGGQPGFETLAKAKELQSDSDIRVVQWLRFGTAGFLQMIGIAHADVWPTVFTRMRTVRDSITPK